MSTARKVDVSVYQKPKKGNYACGDSYFYTETDDEFVCALADGLGSGDAAKDSSQAVINIIKNNIYATVEQLVRDCNKVLTGKRGVVLGILKLNFKANMYSFSSIGNVGMMTVTKDKKKKRNIPNAGYLVGYQRPFKVVKEKLDSGMNFILFSDGVLDKELSQPFFTNKDVRSVIQMYEYTIDKVRHDDTTLITMRYEN